MFGDIWGYLLLFGQLGPSLHFRQRRQLFLSSIIQPNGCINGYLDEESLLYNRANRFNSFPAAEADISYLIWLYCPLHNISHSFINHIGAHELIFCQQKKNNPHLFSSFSPLILKCYFRKSRKLINYTAKNDFYEG
jgi:hypothetical protein